ncbi:MAG: hypothetical protein ABWY39_02060 [Mycobacterium sp.]
MNPDILRSFAGQVDIASDAVHEADVGSKVSTAAEGSIARRRSGRRDWFART